MKDKKRLSCLECDFKSDNLIDHIETKHAKLSFIGKSKKSKEVFGLDAYVGIHKITSEDQLVHPEYVEEEKEADSKIIYQESPVKRSKPEETDSISILDVELPMSLSSTGDSIPKLIPYYHFNAQAKDIALDVIENKRVMLVGQTGCGKTSLIEQIAARLKQSVVRVNLNGQTTVGDFVGLYTAKDGATEWIDGALPRAMKHGYWLILDEIDFAEPQILSVLNSVLEKDGKLFLKEKGYESIEPHENFRIFATANTIGCMQDYRHLYQGANIMNEAFLDRWRCYYTDYMKPEDETKVIIGAIPRYAKAESAVQVIVKVVNMVRDAFNKEEVACTFSTRRAIDWADLMLRYKDPIKAAEVAVFSKINKTDSEVIKGIIQRVMTKR
jgi:cobaltochelatase CobS